MPRLEVQRTERAQALRRCEDHQEEIQKYICGSISVNSEVRALSGSANKETLKPLSISPPETPAEFKRAC